MPANDFARILHVIFWLTKKLNAKLQLMLSNELNAVLVIEESNKAFNH